MRDLLFNSFHLRETSSDAFRLALGRPLADGVYLFPVRAETVEVEGVAFSPSRAGPNVIAHPRAIEALIANVRRPYAYQPGTHDADGQRRRQHALRVFLEQLRDLGEIDARIWPAIIERAADHAFGALAMPSASAAQALRAPGVAELLALSGMAEHDIEARFAAVLARGQSQYTPDEIGKTLDAIAAREEEERQRRRAERRAAEVEASKPNEKACRDLNVIGFRARDVALHLAPRPLYGAMMSSSEFPNPSVLRDDAHAYLFVDRAAFYGVDVAAREITAGIDVLPGDFVPGFTRAELEAAIVGVPPIGLRTWILETLRRKASRVPVKGTFDYKTAEGRARIEQWRATTPARLLLETQSDGADAAAAQAIILSAARDGQGIAPDIIALLLAEDHEKAWRERWAPEREEHERRMRSMSAEQKNYRVTAYEEKPLPSRYSEASMLAAVHAAPALFDPDELFVRDAGMLEKVAAAMGFDPFRAVTDAITEDVIRSEEIESRLRAADLAKGPLGIKDHQRIHGLMKGRGYAKKDVTIDGSRCKAFVRGGEA